MNTTITRTATGVGIIALGIGILLGNLGVFDFGDILQRWWPLIIIVVGILTFLNNPRNAIWSLLIVFIGFLLQVRALDIVSFDLAALIWPSIIIGIGLSILVNRSTAGIKPAKSARDDVTVMFGGVTRKNNSDDYLGGKVAAIAGGVELDLRKATIKKEATMDVFVLAGGIDLKVPASWVVRAQVTPIAGGIENKADPVDDKNAPILTIVGDVIMGGIEIKN